MSSGSGYFRDHWTMSEWLSTSTRREELVLEDGTKRTRLATLRDLMAVPSVVNRVFPYSALLEAAPEVLAFSSSAGSLPYALRLNPIGNGEVQRQRGRPVSELIAWALSLDIDQNDYVCDFERHVDSVSSAVFVCNASGVWGEAHHGPLLELNRGGSSTDIDAFCIGWGSVATGLPSLVSRAIEKLAVSNPLLREVVEREVGAEFHEGYLLGYFEVISDSADELWFVDYNRLLIDECPWAGGAVSEAGDEVLTGRTGSRGRARGVVVHSESVIEAPPQRPGVLVAHATRPELLPAMARSAGVVTEVGGVLSHAAIACRELGIPCLVGVADAMSRLPVGRSIELDADAGTVRVL